MYSVHVCTLNWKKTFEVNVKFISKINKCTHNCKLNMNFKSENITLKGQVKTNIGCNL